MIIKMTRKVPELHFNLQSSVPSMKECNLPSDPLLQAYFPLEIFKYIFSSAREERIFVIFIFLIAMLLNFSWFQSFKVTKNIIIATLNALFLRK